MLSEDEIEMNGTEAHRPSSHGTYREKDLLKLIVPLNDDLAFWRVSSASILDEFWILISVKWSDEIEMGR